jgi:hypothetical protein
MVNQAPLDADDQADWLVTYLANAFDDLAEADREWMSWCEDDRLAFRLDWPIVAETLLRLHVLCDSGRMTPEKWGRCSALFQHAANLQPILDRLLADGTDTHKQLRPDGPSRGGS